MAAFLRQGYVVPTLFLKVLTSVRDQTLPPVVVPHNLDAVPPSFGTPQCGPRVLLDNSASPARGGGGGNTTPGTPTAGHR